MIYDTMLFVYKMDAVDLGGLNIKEAAIETPEGEKACEQDCRLR